MENRRYLFIDNIRWVVVMLILIYHVFYNYNTLGVFGGIGGFEPNQWQDTICTLLNPWFMTLLFVVAGASSRYALQRLSTKEFRRERCRKLLIPSTIGLVVFGWVLGAMNSYIAGANLPEGIPLFVKWIIYAISGTAHLWFIQDLFIFSLALLLVRKLVNVERVDKWLSGLKIWGYALIMVIFFVILWISSKTQIDSPTAVQGLINLYRPIYYFVCFVAGHYIFSSEAIHNYLAEHAKGLITIALGAAIYFAIQYYGTDYTLPAVLQSVWCNLFCWAMVLAMIGTFKRCADRSTSTTQYLSRSSYGVYIVHMTVCTAICLALKQTTLPIWSIYLIAIATTYIGSFFLWEVMRRIPFIRWCVFGITTKQKK